MTLLVVYLVLATLLALEIVLAPEGYEDDAGFHYGVPPPSLQAGEPRSHERNRARQHQEHREIVVVHRR